MIYSSGIFFYSLDLFTQIGFIFFSFVDKGNYLDKESGILLV